MTSSPRPSLQGGLHRMRTANITDSEKRTHASGVWKERIQAFAEGG